MLPAAIRATAVRLAQEKAGPCYVYDAGRIQDVCREFLQISWPEKSIHFATMANAFPPVLQVIREAGLGVFVNSVEHLRLMRSLGFAGDEIVFTASAMEPATMQAVHESRSLVNLDSLAQAAIWQALFPEAKAGLRCNIGERVTPRRTRGGFFLGPESRLGLTVGELEGLAGSTFVEGLHLYAGTDLLELEHFRECYDRLAELAPLFPSLRYLDLGGGFGAPRGDERFDFEAYGRLVDEVMARVSAALGRPIRLILEPGRLVVAQAGYFVCRVVDVKERAGRLLLGVNASSAQFPRPLFYPEDAYHPVTLLRPDGAVLEGEGVPTDIYGCSTYSRDYLGRDLCLPRPAPGDLVVFEHAGAYCASARSEFLGFPPAGSLLV